MTYSVGTITLTNGSRVVTGAGTKFVANVLPSFLLIPVGGAAAAIAEVNSDTQMTLVRPWVAATMNGTGYDIVETSGGDVELSLRALAILNSFGALRDTVGQGRFGDGSVTSPGISFSADQDTGIYRLDQNLLGVTVGGAGRARFTTDRLFVDGLIEVGGPSANVYFSNPVAAWSIGAPANTNAITFVERQFGSEKMRIDAAGNLLVGLTSGTRHEIAKNAPPNAGTVLMVLSTNTEPVAVFRCVQSGSIGSSANAALSLNRDNATNRSINASGTINASGADYAEYMVKADGCGIIAKGDVCGVDRDGKLTKTWADAVSFVIKSTDPSLVGGDIWDAEVGPRPEQPGAEPIEPAAPVMQDGADDAAIAAYREAMAAYPGLVGAYRAEHTAWNDAMAAYAVALKAWEVEHEKARQCVDRIAFCGQVPANVTGDFEVGDYIIAAASGAGIKAVAVKADDMTLPQYMRRIGKVWAIRDGRAWIDVQHG